MQNIIQSLAQISAGINTPFYKDDSFWLSVANIIVLAATLTFLVRSTKATEKSAEASKKMVDEMIVQRMLSDAQDVDFRMRLHYFQNNKGDGNFGDLQQLRGSSTVSTFAFIGHNGTTIGRANKFEPTFGDDDKYLRTHYRMEENGQTRTFIETLQKRNGRIEADVKTTSGNELTYEYEAITQNWKNELLPPEAMVQFPLVNDSFVLIAKRKKV